MNTSDAVKELSRLELDELLALRAAIDARLEAKRKDLLEQAERVGNVIANGSKKRRGRKSEEQTTDMPDGAT